MNNIFSYQEVNDILTKIGTRADDALKELNQISEKLDMAIRSKGEAYDSSTALAGSAATAVKATWENFTANFVNFKDSINVDIVTLKEVAKSKENLEATSLSNIGTH